MAFGQIGWSTEAGMSLTKFVETVKFSRSSASNTGSYRLGPNVGVAINVDLTKRFSIRTGLSYYFSKTKDTHRGTNYIDEITTKIHWMEIPIYFWYKSGIVGTGHFFAGLGPAFDYAISGNEKVKETIYNKQSTKSTSPSRKVQFGNNATSDIRPFNFGGSITGGYVLSSGIYFRAGFTLGIANLIPEGSNRHTLKTRGFNIMVGYLLNNH